jgi:hypothetical protein
MAVDHPCKKGDMPGTQVSYQLPSKEKTRNRKASDQRAHLKLLGMQQALQSPNGRGATLEFIIYINLIAQ